MFGFRPGNKKLLLFIIAFGLLLRLLLIYFTSDVPLQSDADFYRDMAADLSRGAYFTPYYPPGLPLYFYFPGEVFGFGGLAARLSMLPWYLLFSVLLFITTRRIFNGSAANLAVAFFALYPFFILHSIDLLTQLPAASMLLAAVYLLVRLKEKDHPLFPVLLGLTFGYLILLRPSALIFIPFILLYLWFRIKEKRKTVLVFIFILLPVLIWSIKVFNMTGRIIPVNDASSLNFYMGNNEYTPDYKTWWFGSHFTEEEGVPAGFIEELKWIEDQPEAERNSIYMDKALEYIGQNPGEFIKRSFNRFKVYWAFETNTGAILQSRYKAGKIISYTAIAVDAFFYFFLMISAALFFLTRKKLFETFGRYIVFGGIVILYALPYWFSFSHPVYHLPVLPLIFIFGAGFLTEYFTADKERKTEILNHIKRRKILLGLFILAFMYIQAEWALANLAGF